MAFLYATYKGRHTTPRPGFLTLRSSRRSCLDIRREAILAHVRSDYACWNSSWQTATVSQVMVLNKLVLERPTRVLDRVNTRVASLSQISTRVVFFTYVPLLPFRKRNKQLLLHPVCPGGEHKSLLERNR